MGFEFIKWIENRHEMAREWKNKNKKGVIGYFCCVSPEELIYAAGFLPVRITGSSARLEIADEYIPGYACGFARSCLDLAGRGVYDYLDSVIVPNTCDVIARMEYWWRRIQPSSSPTVAGLELYPYVLYLPYPVRVTGRKAPYYLLMQFRVLKQQLERLTNTIITDDMLRAAINVYNEHYLLMGKLDDLRVKHPPLVSGYEAWEAEFSSLLMPKDEHNEIMRNYLVTLSNRQEKSKHGVRIFLSGGALDQETSHLYKIIEECGGQVVREDISVHSSHYQGVNLNTEKSPLEAMVERSLGVPCPRSTVETTADAPWPEFRWEYVKKTIKDADIEGAIFYNLNYCECRSSEVPHLKEKLKEELGVPTLILEGDYTLEGLEDTRDRIETFVEMIRELA